MIPSRSVPGSVASTRVNSISLPPSSPALGSCEDLARFPSESLHSFSFANQSEDLIHNRQNILKRSIEFMRDKLGWSTRPPLIATAQAKVNGDEEEVESMMELLRKADLVPDEKTPMFTGLVTGSAGVDNNPFEQGFSSKQPPRLDTRCISDVSMLSTSPKSGPLLDIPAGSPITGSGSQVAVADTPSPPPPNSQMMRTYTDTSSLALQTKLFEALAQPYLAADEPLSAASGLHLPSFRNSSVHGHTSRFAPPAQAIFTTESQNPWTILAANDLACLVFGVTMAEVRKIGIMEVVKPERRQWLADKLNSGDNTSTSFPYPHSHHGSPQPTSVLYGNGGRRVKSDAYYTGASRPTNGHSGANHRNNLSRGVILCGDVVPIQKRNGNTGAASLWVKEKRGGLIWVLEEISEDVAYIYTSRREDGTEYVERSEGALENIFGSVDFAKQPQLRAILPTLPKKADGNVDSERIGIVHQFTAASGGAVRVPCGVEPTKDGRGLRVSAFSHIAGIIVLSASDLRIASTNAVFSSALLGQVNPVGLSIMDIIPRFDRMIEYLTKEENISLVDGMVIPEHSFRKASAITALREGGKAISALSIPGSVVARHRDGTEIHIDVQMRIVISEAQAEQAIVADDEEEATNSSEMVYALWITYSKHLHLAAASLDPLSPEVLRPATPPKQPSPGQPSTPVTPTPPGSQLVMSKLSKQLETIEQSPPTSSSEDERKEPIARQQPLRKESTTPMNRRRKTIADFVILEDMGQGAYGQVKLARYKKKEAKRVVLKYVIKRRILVDTWTRDRRLGTVPLEIHVLDYLGRDGLKHPNIVEMTDFFEDDINYYIEMVPHGLPGMDLFDYIELKVNMDEDECRSIFVQVVRALHHLHTKALVVHRDIKDENVVLDGDGNIKLIDFGSAAYIKNGPFDVFVGTIGM
jgi:protein-serine/threonine kinase